jgi:hypothetical protein
MFSKRSSKTPPPTYPEDDPAKSLRGLPHHESDFTRPPEAQAWCAGGGFHVFEETGHGYWLCKVCLRACDDPEQLQRRRLYHT